MQRSGLECQPVETFSAAYRHWLALAHAVKIGGLSPDERREHGQELIDYLQWESARFRHYAELFGEQETSDSFLDLARLLGRFAERTREVCEQGDSFSTDDWEQLVEEALEDNQHLVEQIAFLRE